MNLLLVYADGTVEKADAPEAWAGGYPVYWNRNGTVFRSHEARRVTYEDGGAVSLLETVVFLERQKV